MFSAQTIRSEDTVPIDVQFTMLDVKDPYEAPEPLPGAHIRLVLGEGPNWRDADAGHRFVTDARGEARFTMNGLIDTDWRSRNIGFTPFSLPSRADHLSIAVELEHRFPVKKGDEPRKFRWLLTMDLYGFPDGQCSTVGFMSIITPDAKGRFTRPLARQGSTESWKVPELNGQVIWGMSYKVADFRLSRADENPGKRILKLVLKRLPRRSPE